MAAAGALFDEDSECRRPDRDMDKFDRIYQFTRYSADAERPLQSGISDCVSNPRRRSFRIIKAMRDYLAAPTERVKPGFSIDRIQARTQLNDVADDRPTAELDKYFATAYGAFSAKTTDHCPSFLTSAFAVGRRRELAPGAIGAVSDGRTA